MTFGQRLKRLRYKLGLSQKEMAERLGVHLMTISRYERDAMKPSFRFLEKVRETFNVNPKWLLEGEGEMFLPKKTPKEAVRTELFGLKGATLDFLAEELAEKLLAESLLERGYLSTDSINLYSELVKLAKEKIKAHYQSLKAEIGFHLDTWERFLPPPPKPSTGDGKSSPESSEPSEDEEK
ncbi:helix-turn-helix domain-containing protein [Thermovibrio sp.]